MKTKWKSSVGMTLLAAGLWGAAVAASATEIVVIVNPKNPATRMFSEQAAQFFLGKSTLFTPVERNDGAAIRSEFYQKVLNKDATGQGHLVQAGVYRQGRGAQGIRVQRRRQEGGRGRRERHRLHRKIGRRRYRESDLDSAITPPQPAARAPARRPFSSPRQKRGRGARDSRHCGDAGRCCPWTTNQVY